MSFLGLMTVRAHEAVVADRGAIDEALLPMVAIIDRMSIDWGYPSADIAMDVGQTKEQVMVTLRFLQAIGLAKRHPFFSEDDSAIRGSGYSLTSAGGRLKQTLAALKAKRDQKTRNLKQFRAKGDNRPAA